MAVMIWDPFERALWGLAIGMGIICSIFYFNRGRQRENRWEKTFMYGFTLFILCLSIARIFYFLGELEIIGTFQGYTFVGDFSIVQPLYEFYNRAYYLLADVGIIFFVLAFELYVKRTKFILTIISIITTIVILVIPFNEAYLLHNYVFFPFSLLIFIAVFFLMAKYSRADFKAVGPLILSGIIIGGLAAVYSGPEFKELEIIPLAVPPLLFILGTVLLIAPIAINPRKISRKVIYVIIGCLGLFLIIMALGYVLYDTPIELFSPIVIVDSVLIYIFLKIIKNMRSAEIRRTKRDVPSVIAMFTRPKKVTEEEVSISKEKKTCLVCKGKLARAMYLCPECNSFYCANCSETLITLENACWVCECAIDESKPVKPFEKDEKEEAKSKKHKEPVKEKS